MSLSGEAGSWTVATTVTQTEIRKKLLNENIYASRMILSFNKVKESENLR